MRRKRRIVAVFLCGIILLSFSQKGFGEEKIVQQEDANAFLEIKSTAFSEGGNIPLKHTCEGGDVSPPLNWTPGPKGTQSFAIIMEDPDVPGPKAWAHWLVYHLPPTVQNLPEGLPSLKVLANGEKQGMTDFKTMGYGGPCPPQGEHRYYFKLYALDTVPRLNPGATREELSHAMIGHILAEASLMGKYEKKADPSLPDFPTRGSAG